MPRPIPVIRQLPVESRYTAEWYDLFANHPDFEVLGNSHEAMYFDRSKPYNYFTNLEDEVTHEAAQLASFVYCDRADDLLVCDGDFPGLTACLLPVLRLKFPGLKLYAVFHGGSWNYGDIFQGDEMKIGLERLALTACEKVFVATNYHKWKISKHLGVSGRNIVVLGGMPLYANKIAAHKSPTKPNDIIVLGRQEQSSLMAIEDWPNAFRRVKPMPREEYWHFLSTYKVAVIAKSEETFGYEAMECLALGVIPLVPNAYSYRELYPALLRYRGQEQLHDLAQRALESPGPFFKAMSQVKLSQFSCILDDIAKAIRSN